MRFWVYGSGLALQVLGGLQGQGGYSMGLNHLDAH